VIQDTLSYVSQAFTDLLNRFSVTLSYPIAVLGLYPMLTKGRRYLLHLISLSTSVKNLLCGQMWRFYSSIRGAADKKRPPRNSRSGYVTPGVCSTINLSAFISMGSCL